MYLRFVLGVIVIIANLLGHVVGHMPQTASLDHFISKITTLFTRSYGGGGGDRTPVRKVSTEGVYMLIL